MTYCASMVYRGRAARVQFGCANRRGRSPKGVPIIGGSAGKKARKRRGNFRGNSTFRNRTLFLPSIGYERSAIPPLAHQLKQAVSVDTQLPLTYGYSIF